MTYWNDMIKKLLCIYCFFLNIYCFGQSTIEEKFELPDDVKETSGLLFFNEKVITHNDSGDGPYLYEIDTIHGNISRVITITNATHIDWEDISQDDTYIYIADIGNNDGNREDLKIYKVFKSDYTSSTNVTAEIISFSYEDQTDFSSQPNHTNFDAEAIAVYQDSLLIFTKNWVDNKTNAYAIPKTVGDHVAAKVSSYDVKGLITGVSYNPYTDAFLFSGYNSILLPFLIYVDQNRPPSLDVFGGSVTKINLVDPLYLEQGSQIEGVAFFEPNKYYISREYFSNSIAGITIIFEQKLYEFYNELDYLLSTSDNELSKLSIHIPNPVEEELEIFPKNNSHEILSLSIIDIHGKKLLSVENQNKLNLGSFSKGLYFLKIRFKTGEFLIKKIIKK